MNPFILILVFILSFAQGVPFARRVEQGVVSTGLISLPVLYIYGRWIKEPETAGSRKTYVEVALPVTPSYPTFLPQSYFDELPILPSSSVHGSTSPCTNAQPLQFSPSESAEKSMNLDWMQQPLFPFLQDDLSNYIIIQQEIQYISSTPWNSLTVIPVLRTAIRFLWNEVAFDIVEYFCTGFLEYILAKVCQILYFRRYQLRDTADGLAACFVIFLKALLALLFVLTTGLWHLTKNISCLVLSYGKEQLTHHRNERLALRQKVDELRLVLEAKNKELHVCHVLSNHLWKQIDEKNQYLGTFDSILEQQQNVITQQDKENTQLKQTVTQLKSNTTQPTTRHSALHRKSILQLKQEKEKNLFLQRTSDVTSNEHTSGTPSLDTSKFQPRSVRFELANADAVYDATSRTPVADPVDEEEQQPIHTTSDIVSNDTTDGTPVTHDAVDQLQDSTPDNSESNSNESEDSSGDSEDDSNHSDDGSDDGDDGNDGSGDSDDGFDDSDGDSPSREGLPVVIVSVGERNDEEQALDDAADDNAPDDDAAGLLSPVDAPPDQSVAQNEEQTLTDTNGLSANPSSLANTGFTQASSWASTHSFDFSFNDPVTHDEEGVLPNNTADEAATRSFSNTALDPRPSCVPSDFGGFNIDHLVQPSEEQIQDNTHGSTADTSSSTNTAVEQQPSFVPRDFGSFNIDHFVQPDEEQVQGDTNDNTTNNSFPSNTTVEQQPSFVPENYGGFDIGHPVEHNEEQVLDTNAGNAANAPPLFNIAVNQSPPWNCSDTFNFNSTDSMPYNEEQTPGDNNVNMVNASSTEQEEQSHEPFFEEQHAAYAHGNLFNTSITEEEQVANPLPDDAPFPGDESFEDIMNSDEIPSQQDIEQCLTIQNTEPEAFHLTRNDGPVQSAGNEASAANTTQMDVDETTHDDQQIVPQLTDEELEEFMLRTYSWLPDERQQNSVNDEMQGTTLTGSANVVQGPQTAAPETRHSIDDSDQMDGLEANQAEEILQSLPTEQRLPQRVSDWVLPAPGFGSSDHTGQPSSNNLPYEGSTRDDFEDDDAMLGTEQLESFNANGPVGHVSPPLGSFTDMRDRLPSIASPRYSPRSTSNQSSASYLVSPPPRSRRASDYSSVMSPQFLPSEPIQEPASEPDQEPVQEPVQEPDQEPVQETVQEPYQEPVQETVQESPTSEASSLSTLTASDVVEAKVEMEYRLDAIASLSRPQAEPRKRSKRTTVEAETRRALLAYGQSQNEITSQLSTLNMAGPAHDQNAFQPPQTAPPQIPPPPPYRPSSPQKRGRDDDDDDEEEYSLPQVKKVRQDEPEDYEESIQRRYEEVLLADAAANEQEKEDEAGVMPDAPPTEPFADGTAFRFNPSVEAPATDRYDFWSPYVNELINPPAPATYLISEEPTEEEVEKAAAEEEATNVEMTQDDFTRQVRSIDDTYNDAVDEHDQYSARSHRGLRWHEDGVTSANLNAETSGLWRKPFTGRYADHWTPEKIAEEMKKRFASTPGSRLIDRSSSSWTQQHRQQDDQRAATQAAQGWQATASIEEKDKEKRRKKAEEAKKVEETRRRKRANIEAIDREIAEERRQVEEEERRRRVREEEEAERRNAERRDRFNEGRGPEDEDMYG